MLAHLAAAFLTVTPPAPSPTVQEPSGATVAAVMSQEPGTGPSGSTEAPLAQPEKAPVATDVDLERLRVHLAVEAEQARLGRISLSVINAGVGVGLAALALPAGRIAEGGARTDHLAGALALSGIVTGLGLLPLLMPSFQEQLLAELDAGVGPSAERVPAFERRFAQAAREARTGRYILGGVIGGLGLLSAGVGTARELDAQARGEPLNGGNLLIAYAGTVLTASGIATLFFHRNPVEASWERYAQDPAVKARMDAGPEVQVGVGPMGREGVGLALAGRF